MVDINLLHFSLDKHHVRGARARAMSSASNARDLKISFVVVRQRISKHYRSVPSGSNIPKLSVVFSNLKPVLGNVDRDLHHPYRVESD